jgi:hypothetical protein
MSPLVALGRSPCVPSGSVWQFAVSSCSNSPSQIHPAIMKHSEIYLSFHRYRRKPRVVRWCCPLHDAVPLIQCRTCRAIARRKARCRGRSHGLCGQCASTPYATQCMLAHHTVCKVRVWPSSSVFASSLSYANATAEPATNAHACIRHCPIDNMCATSQTCIFYPCHEHAHSLTRQTAAGCSWWLCSLPARSTTSHLPRTAPSACSRATCLALPAASLPCG